MGFEIWGVAHQFRKLHKGQCLMPTYVLGSKPHEFLRYGSEGACHLVVGWRLATHTQTHFRTGNSDLFGQSGGFTRGAKSCSCLEFDVATWCRLEYRQCVVLVQYMQSLYSKRFRKLFYACV